MADYRRYQPRRSTAAPSWRRFALIGAGVLILFFVIKGVLGGGGETNTNTTNSTSSDDEITLLNDNTNSSANTNESTNTNANSNTNISNTNVAPPTTSFTAAACNGSISQFGTKKSVALTFDLAAANDATDQVIATLRQEKVGASFFSSGTFAEKNPDLLTTLSQAGFGVYNRSYDNPSYSKLSAEDIAGQLSRADKAISEATDVTTKPFARPPFGDSNASVVAAAKSEGYCIILWTVDAFDWQDGIAAADSAKRVMDKLRSGMIVSLHAGYDVTPAVVTSLIKDIKAKGYDLVSLADLVST